MCSFCVYYSTNPDYITKIQLNLGFLEKSTTLFDLIKLVSILIDDINLS